MYIDTKSFEILFIVPGNFKFVLVVIKKTCDSPKSTSSMSRLH